MVVCLGYLVLLLASVCAGLARGRRHDRRRVMPRYDWSAYEAALGVPANDPQPAASLTPPIAHAARWRLADADGWRWGTAARHPAYGASLLTMGFVLIDLSRLAVEAPAESLGGAAKELADPAHPQDLVVGAPASDLATWDALSAPASFAWLHEPHPEPQYEAQLLGWQDSAPTLTNPAAPEHGWFV